MLDSPELLNVLGLSLGLGLFGFVEPCTVASSLLFVKYLEGRDRAAKIRTTVIFAATRALFIGGLGAVAAVAGSYFMGAQRGFWIFLGVLYLGLGIVYLAEREAVLLRSIGPTLARVGEDRGAAALGVLFGLNIPACAAPLLGALLAASLGVGTALRGVLSLGVFGLALSLPLVAVVFWERGRVLLDRLAGLSRRAPRWTGIAFAVLGIWSIYFGLTVTGA